jgi:hypothetical protein
MAIRIGVECNVDPKTQLNVLSIHRCLNKAGMHGCGRIDNTKAVVAIAVRASLPRHPPWYLVVEAYCFSHQLRWRYCRSRVDLIPPLLPALRLHELCDALAAAEDEYFGLIETLP